MKYTIGFDGGGTKTEMVVVDMNGHELFLRKGGASNPKAVTFEKAMDHITELLDGLYEKGSVESGSVEAGSTESCSIEQRSNESGSAEQGSKESGSAKQGSNESDSAKQGSNESDSTEPGSLEPGTTEAISLEPGLCQGICLGLAGITLEQEKLLVQQHIRQYYAIRGVHALPVRVTNDAEIALMAGLGDNKGIIAIAGTGAIVYGITPAGHTYRAGGWGHILGDKGSGYEIGLQALQTVMFSYDGVRPPTALTELILDKYGLSSPLELRTYIYQSHIQKKHIAEFAELCIQASEAGDPAAQGIITNEATELAGLTAAIYAKDEWFVNSPVAVTGSIFKYSRLFRDTYKEQLGSVWTQPNVTLSEQKPSYGAAMLAMRVE
ncbi:N-acetylglucosamine kinase [Paenibacillus eucommiae]|uniref:N-acetylglucosamine kinase-like BadF-type ATPase n=1 Tax=Paenibacillus eucommiae TaxID=1355755 RepID=A0ABS4J1Y7_9BACL|nr:BadF/BadG/BcrA/BcrD ATPase family protein [Paenibacillus eucommiae]MBP1993146.1 N-acetylglucosamine kinase-like BadF-type ATPase [Paenibacillus eucommiae]